MRKERSCNDEYPGCVAFSPDDLLLAIGGVDRTIKLWRTADWTLETTLKGHWGTVSDVAFFTSNAGRPSLVSVSNDQTAVLWDLSDRRNWKTRDEIQLDSRDDPAPSVVSAGGNQYPALALSPNNDVLAVAWKGQVSLWELDTMRRMPTGIETVCPVVGIAISGKGVLATGGVDGTVRLYDLRTRQLQQSPLIGHQGNVTELEFCRGREFLAAGTDTGEVRFWDLEDRTRSSIFGDRTRRVDDLAFGFNEEQGKIIASTGGGELYLWFVDTGRKELLLRDKQTKYLHSVAVFPDGRLIVAGDPFAGLFVWDLSNLGRGAEPFKTPTRGLEFSADGSTLFSEVNGERALRVWDVATRRVRCTLELDERGGSLAVSRDGEIVVAGSTTKGRISVLRAPKEKSEGPRATESWSVLRRK